MSVAGGGRWRGKREGGRRERFIAYAEGLGNFHYLLDLGDPADATPVDYEEMEPDERPV